MMDRSSAQPSSPPSGSGKGSTSNPSGKSGIADQIEILKSDMSGLAEKITGFTKEQLSNTASNAEVMASDKAQELKNMITKSPMQSIAVSIGVGFVLGLLLSK